MEHRSFALVALGLVAVGFTAGCVDSATGRHISLVEYLLPKPPPPKTDNLGPADPGYVDPGPWVGPLGKKYAGRVVFSRAPIAGTATDDADVYTGAYPLGEPLYIRYWSAESPHNRMPLCKSPRIILRGEVNGDNQGKPVTSMHSFGLYQLPTDSLTGRDYGSLSNDNDAPFTKGSTLDLSRREDAGERAVRELNATLIPRLVEGANDLHVAVTLDCGSSGQRDPVFAEGHLNVTVPPGGVAAYLTRFGTQIAPSPHPENAELVPQILAAMKRKPDWDNEDLVGARVISRGWIPVRNELTGVLVEKAVEAVLVVHARKEKLPELCRAFDMSYRRDASGGDLYFAGTGSSTPFPCSNAPR
jgi:hypothetical protein